MKAYMSSPEAHAPLWFAPEAGTPGERALAELTRILDETEPRQGMPASVRRFPRGDARALALAESLAAVTRDGSLSYDAPPLPLARTVSILAWRGPGADRARALLAERAS